MRELYKVLDYNIFDSDNFHISIKQILTIGIFIGVTFVLLKVLKATLIRNSKNDSDRGRKISVFKIISYISWLAVIFVCLELAGVPVTVFVASSAALFVGLGLGLQHIFGDIVSGVVMLVEGTIQVGDIIEVDGLVVRVEEMNIRASKVLTRDYITLYIPNHKFVSENVINWSQKGGLARFKIDVGVAYGSDVDLVERILLECMQENRDVSHNDPISSPLVMFKDFGESSLNFAAFFYTERVFLVEQVKSRIRKSINAKFIEHGINIPFPQRVVHMKTES